MLGLKRPSVLSFWSYRFQHVGNVTFAIDGHFDAGRRRQGRASGSFLSLSCFICTGPLLWRTNAMPRSAPAFALNLHDGVSPTSAKWFHWEHNRRACNCLFGKIGKTLHIKVGCEQNTRLC